MILCILINEKGKNYKNEAMTTHKFWGKVQENWKGFSPETMFSHPFFENQKTEIFLGEEYDDDGEEIEELPTENQLTEFAKTYQNFIQNIEKHLADIQQKSFERYQKLYARYYENLEKSGEQPLKIDTVEKHNIYIKDLMYLRVLEDKTIKISIRYRLDTEHGLEFRFTNGMITEVGGIAET